MNTGIQDAYNLAWKLALVVSGTASESLLDSYPEERMAVAESVLKLSDNLLRTATSNSRLVKLLRNHLAPLLLNTNLAQHRMTEQISEVAIHYRDSSLVHSFWHNRTLFPGHHPHPGDRAPDVQYDHGGAERRFHHLLCGTQFALFLFVGDAQTMQQLEQQLLSWRCREEFVLYRVCRDDANRLPGYQTVVDPGQAIAERYGLAAGGMLIIRPDGYIGYLSDTVDMAQVRAYAGRVLVLDR